MDFCKGGFGTCHDGLIEGGKPKFILFLQGSDPMLSFWGSYRYWHRNSMRRSIWCIHYPKVARGDGGSSLAQEGYSIKNLDNNQSLWEDRLNTRWMSLWVYFSWTIILPKPGFVAFTNQKVHHLHWRKISMKHTYNQRLIIAFQRQREVALFWY